MSKRIVVAFIVVALALGFLIYQGVSTTAKAVVTVGELFEMGNVRNNIRLGARMTEDPIVKSVDANKKFSFYVRDITNPGDKKLLIESEQTIPDTLRSGRDVILEGNFDGEKFVAKNLMTQCPSKYEPPKPQ